MAKAFSIEDGNLQNRSLVTTRSRLYKDIDLTFDNRPSGDVYKKTDVAAVKQAVKNLLLTNWGEKPFLPRYGANLGGLLFELGDDTTEDDIRISVQSAIEIYEPRAQLLDVVVNFLPEYNSISVQVQFQILNTEEIVAVETTIARLR